MTIKPRYSFKKKETRPGEFQVEDVDFPNTTESYKLYSKRIIASGIKEYTIPGVENFAEIAPSFPGLPQIVIDSISKCDVDYRRELFSSILLSGGTLPMQQLKERLEKDLKESPRAARVIVLASGNATERYEAHGASYVQREVPLIGCPGNNCK
ncbi:hypothetical protein ACLB2K_061615 [Fragaria x ananassa]